MKATKIKAARKPARVTKAAESSRLEFEAPPVVERILRAVAAAEDLSREELLEIAVVRQIGFLMEMHDLGGTWGLESDQNLAPYQLRVLLRGGSVEEAQAALEQYAAEHPNDPTPGTYEQPPALSEIRRAMREAESATV